MKSLRLFAFIAVAFSTSPASAGDPVGEIDALVKSEMARERAPGIAVAVIRKGDVVKAAGYGLADVERNVPVTADTVFQSGSVGKQFTAALAMLMVEEGRMSLDDPVAKWLPGAPWHGMTIRHLLTHTSGLPPDVVDDKDLTAAFSEDDLVKKAFKLKLQSKPGERWSYSNCGYVLLGIVLHKASGRFYGDLLHDRIFAPIGMKTARIISERDIVANRAAGYEMDDGELKNQSWVSPSLNTTADGSLYLTLKDLIAWDRAIRERAILKPESWTQIFTPVRLNSGNTYPYGFGWFLPEIGGQKVQRHSGSWQGFKTYIARYLGDDLTVIVLANSAHATPYKFVHGIAALFNPALAPNETPIEDPEPRIAARVVKEIQEHHRDLIAGAGDLQRIELMERRPEGDDVAYRYRATYAFATLDVELAFARSGKVYDFLAKPIVRPTLIRNARLIDGSGAEPRRADVRIVDARVNAIGDLEPERGETVIDADGLTLAPGFIDTHSHHDDGLDQEPDALAAVSQGITTIIVGQDGDSALPLAKRFAELQAHPAAINVASYAGHGSVRMKVMGKNYKRVATSEEIAKMSALVEQAMKDGALGLSTGLEYDPGIYSSRAEVLALAKVAAAHDGRYISHMRSEDREFWPALDELIDIGRVTGMPVQVSHIKLAMRALWGKGGELIERMDRARAQGVRISADVYPYTMWQSTLTVMYPKRNFSDRAETDFILKNIAAPEDLVIGKYALRPAYSGKSIAQLAVERKEDPATTLMALIAETQAKHAEESVVATSMDEGDIAKLMRWSQINICSDGMLHDAHPRGRGSFPRVLAHYVRDEHVLKLEEAVRKMTSAAAEHVGLRQRGTIAPGYWADLVLFDPKSVADHATIQDPSSLSTGIERVWVNGQIVFEQGKATGRHPGRVLRHGRT